MIKEARDCKMCKHCSEFIDELTCKIMQSKLKNDTFGEYDIYTLSNTKLAVNCGYFKQISIDEFYLRDKFIKNFDSALSLNVDLLYPSDLYNRCCGKTSSLNEIGYFYQALGYNVVVLSSHKSSIIYNAEVYIDDLKDLSYYYNKDVICLVDEYNIKNNLKYMRELSSKLNIRFIGFYIGEHFGLDKDYRKGEN